MALGHIDELEGKIIENDEVKGAVMKVLISPEEGWDSHVMRVFEVAPNGFTPKHTHDWPHINYIIEGEGTLFLSGKENPIKAGSYAYVPSNELHQFKNTSNKAIKFICIVPKEGHY
ncbi:cupin domain-containing protein [Helicovermis profundi]|uniref:Cupin domain-containing protein n=1 Tax=Helicovermis profundi TaxID=3065157 RepID=A0AAU9E1T6_9FIRM|nr:cupin domain-containing protein [Clostridia bacterium S502]